MTRACPPDTYPDLAAAKDAATAARIRRALKGRKAGGSTTDARWCAAHNGWHLINTTTRRKAPR